VGQCQKLFKLEQSAPTPHQWILGSPFQWNLGSFTFLGHFNGLPLDENSSRHVELYKSSRLIVS
jgi:hypothetical protein